MLWEIAEGLTNSEGCAFGTAEVCPKASDLGTGIYENCLRWKVKELVREELAGITSRAVKALKTAADPLQDLLALVTQHGDDPDCT
jgi:hypothetical protein